MHTKVEVCMNHKKQGGTTYHYILGEEIAYNTALKLLDLIYNTPAPRLCWLHMTADMHTNVNRCYDTKQGYRYSTLNIQADFNKRISCPCDKTLNHYDAETKVEKCHELLCAGKCRDEFIQKTLGAVLFPQHYAKDKQK